MCKQLLYLFFAISIFSSCTKDEQAVPQVESIKVNETEAKLKVGESLFLTISHFPENLPAPDYVWSTDSPKILNVQSDGSMIALQVGKATVTVKTLDGRLSASCTINVLPVNADGIALNKTTLKLVLGTSETLSYTISPPSATNKEVIWTSLNSDIAVVDQLGKVTAIGVGDTEIEVISKDGKVKTACKVVVEPILVTSLSISKSAASLIVGETTQLSVSILPANATNKSITWSSSNSSIANVDADGTVTAVGVGNVEVSAKSENGKIASSLISVKDPLLAINGYTVGGMIISSSVTYTLGIYFVNETSVDAIVKNVKVKNAAGTTIYSGDMNDSVKGTRSTGEQIVSLTSQGNFLNSWTVEITYIMHGKSQRYVMNVGKSR